MNRVKASFYSSLCFLRTFFAPKVNAVTYTPNGHAVLSDWEFSPQERLIAEAKAKSAMRPEKARVGLFCTAGAHKGELFLLSRPIETIGLDLTNTVVMTSSDETRAHRFRVFLNGSVTLSGAHGELFTVNGMQTNKADLYDYDEVEILGNKFTVFDFPYAAQEAH